MYSKNMLSAGYALDRQGMFKAPEIGGWHIYICGPKLVEELCKLPDDTLDIQAAARIVRHITNICPLVLTILSFLLSPVYG